MSKDTIRNQLIPFPLLLTKLLELKEAQSRCHLGAHSQVTESPLDTFMPKNHLILLITIPCPLQESKHEYLLKFSSQVWPIQGASSALLSSLCLSVRLLLLPH